MSYSNNSYEGRLLYWLSTVDKYFMGEGLTYGLFGGAAVAAYVGHLPRKLHDLDILASPQDGAGLISFLESKGFHRQRSRKNQRADFAKLLLKNHVYEMIASVFPAKFTLLDVDEESLPVLGVYDFRESLQRTSRHEIKSLSGSQAVSVSVVALEDLIISKLWPTFEPSTVHDLLLLLSCRDASQLDFAYLRRRLESNLALCDLCLKTLEKFQSVFPRTAWYQLAGQNATLRKTLSQLMAALAEVSQAAF